MFAIIRGNWKSIRFPLLYLKKNKKLYKTLKMYVVKINKKCYNKTKFGYFFGGVFWTNITKIKC